MNASSVRQSTTANPRKANKAFCWKVISSALICAAALFAPSAHADSYSFSFSGGGLSGSGVITYSTTPVPGVPGGYQVTGITGTFSDANAGLLNAAITGINSTSLPTNINPDGTFIPPGRQADGFPFSFDNLFFPGGDSPVVCPPPDRVTRSRPIPTVVAISTSTASISMSQAATASICGATASSPDSA